MLPGIRFLFAAVALSVSILIFGLGAAALLRAAHEEFSSNSSWRAAPEPPMVAQQSETRPVLALLRFDPPQGARETATDAPTSVLPATSPATSAPAEPESVVPPAPEPQNVAAQTAADTQPPRDAATVETANADIATADLATSDTIPAPTVSASEPAPAPAPEAAMTDQPAAAPVAETKVAATEATGPSENDAARAAKPEGPDAAMAETAPARTDTIKPEPAASLPAHRAAAKIATGGAPVAGEQSSRKKDASEKAERRANKAHLRAEARAKARRRLAAQRARAARQAAAQQQQLGLFAQQPTTATTLQK